MRDVPLGVDVDHLTLGGWDRSTAEATFERYEMKTVWQRMEELLDAGALGEPEPGSAGPASAGPAGGVATAPDRAPAEPAAPALELRDVALADDRRGGHQAARASSARGAWPWRRAGTESPAAASWLRSSWWRPRATRRASG